MQEAMAGAWTAFARNGRPDVPQLPAWRPYSAHERPTLVFDRRSVLVDDPWRDERLALEPFPPYAPAIGEGQRTW
jgi:para-nitrobenzyl esterase